jgi:hypothetical protein
MSLLGLALIIAIYIAIRWLRQATKLVRVNQHPPARFTIRLAKNCMVVGISQSEPHENAKAMMKGKRRSLRLERDPTNKYDSNAIKVIGHWQDRAETEHQGRIGYVPRDIAAKIATRAAGRELYAAIELLIPSRPFKSPGVRMDIWTHRKEPKRGAPLTAGAVELLCAT